jgi:hypothetical protein
VSVEDCACKGYKEYHGLSEMKYSVLSVGRLYIYMCVCVCVCVCVNIYVYIYIYIYIYVYMYVCMYVCMYMYISDAGCSRRRTRRYIKESTFVLVMQALLH